MCVDIIGGARWGQGRDDRAGRLELDDPEQPQPGLLPVPDGRPEDDRAGPRRLDGGADVGGRDQRRGACTRPTARPRPASSRWPRPSPRSWAGTASGSTPSRRATWRPATRTGRKANGPSTRSTRWPRRAPGTSPMPCCSSSSSLAERITGQTLIVDGGAIIRDLWGIHEGTMARFKTGNYDRSR